MEKMHDRCTLLHNQFSFGDACARFLQLLSAVVEFGSEWGVGWPHVLSCHLVKGTSSLADVLA